jgi:hypothetical protein
MVRQLADDRKKRAVGVLRRAEITQPRVRLGRQARSSSVAVSRDLPIPASPDSSTTWPSPDFALNQRRSSSSDSFSRPTSAVMPLARSASKRLSTELARSAAQARTGTAMPLRSLPPRSCSSNRLPRSLRVLSAMTTMFGSANLCRRAASTARDGVALYLLLRHAPADSFVAGKRAINILPTL